MNAERLSLDELKERCTEIFYDFMSSEEEKFYDDTSYVDFNKDYPTPMHMLWKETQNTIAENTARIKMFEEAIEENKNDQAVVDTLKEQLQPLLEEKEHFNKSCMSYMKELYAKTGVVDYSRNIVRIPLDKRINSFYDDLVLEVLFYDDIGVNAGQFDTYKALETQEARREFIKANTEITHFGLVVLGRSNNHVATIGLLGDLNFDDERVKQSGIVLLGSEYADFNSLTLKKTMDVQNNDLRQFLQTKIDLDKENMKVLAEAVIGTDDYKILESKEKDGRGNKMLFIRYVCPSTQRVYYNIINKQFIAFSEYYKEEDYKSYIYAWWNVCHVGADPMEGLAGRC